MKKMSEIKEFTDVDQDTVDNIVQKMRKKEVAGTVIATEEDMQMRGEMLGKSKPAKIEIGNVGDFLDFNSQIIHGLIEFYLKLQDPLKPIAKFIAQLSATQTLNYYLHSANLKYTLNQYLAITTAITVLATLWGIVMGLLIGFILRVPFVFYPLLAVFGAVFAGTMGLFITLLVPKSIAETRGAQVSIEMPFALRHMATELRSGAGLYRTIQLIAVADYGVLSEEFARTVNEIEEGTDAKDALKNMANRVQSIAMRNALNHIVRAMKTGGNLSEVMSDIADDVSVEIRNRISEFSEKMNFFGVLFIFAGIIIPVMIAILGGISNAPLPMAFPIPLSIPLLIIFYLVVMPVILGILILYLRAIQPKA